MAAKKWVFTVFFFFTPVTGPYFVEMYEFQMFFVGAPLVMENPNGYFYVVVGAPKRGKSTMEIEVLLLMDEAKAGAIEATKSSLESIHLLFTIKDG